MSPPGEKNLPVAIPGARGAYGQKAAQRFFGSYVALFCDTAAAAVHAVLEGRASHAVLPVENSITGAFDGVAEALFEGEVSVIGEVLLPIRHALMGASGARLESLAVVASHPSSLSQCRDWITSWGFTQRPVSDTAKAAEELAECGDEALGVLGNRELAQTYGLQLLAEGLSDHADNRTRFLVVVGGDPEPSGGWRNVIQVGPVRTPRTLKTLRIQLESLGASRVRVPFLGSPDGKRFLVEFDHRGGRGPVVAREACTGMPHRFLGAWTPNLSQRVAG